MLAATHGEGREQAREITLEAGQSARVERPGKDAEVRLVVLQPIGDVPAKDFVRHMPSLAERQKSASQAYADLVLSLGPAVYYRMEGPKPGEDLLQVFDSAPGGHHGKAYGNPEAWIDKDTPPRDTYPAGLARRCCFAAESGGKSISSCPIIPRRKMIG